MTTTPGAPATPGGRPPDRVPTPQCLFHTDTKTGTAVAPAGSVGGSTEDELFAILWASPLKSVAFEEALDRLLTYDSGTPAAQTPMVPRDVFGAQVPTNSTQGAAAAAPTSSTPTPADRTSGDLGAQVATATAGVTEFLCDPSPISPRVVLGAQVPTNFHDCPPRRPGPGMGGRDDRDASGRPTMLQGPSRGLCSAQTSGSPMTLSSATAAGSAPKASFDTLQVDAGLGRRACRRGGGEGHRGSGSLC